MRIIKLAICNKLNNTYIAKLIFYTTINILYLVRTLINELTSVIIILTIVNFYFKILVTSYIFWVTHTTSV